MKHTEKRTWPASEYEAVVQTTCDLCRQDIPAAKLHQTKEIEVSMRIGLSWPSGDGNGTVWDFDVCEGCMRSVILKLFSDAGCSVEGKDYDY